jgi:hypothetical protein
MTLPIQAAERFRSMFTLFLNPAGTPAGGLRIFSEAEMDSKFEFLLIFALVGLVSFLTLDLFIFCALAQYLY